MKYLFLLSSLLMLVACTTHYSDDSPVGFAESPAVRGGSFPKSYQADVQLTDVTSATEISTPRAFPKTVISKNAINGEYLAAAKQGQNDVIAAMLNQGANVNFANAQGETVLHIAAASGNYALADLVLARGASVNALTSGGWTALHSAARFGHLEIVDLLLQAGVETSAINSDGKTALDLARLMRNSAIVSRLSR